MAPEPVPAADYERDVLTVLRLLTEAVAAVKSMSMGGEYEDLPLWEVEKILDRMADRIDGQEAP